MSLHHWSDKQLLLSACDFASSDSEMVFCHISTDLKERALWLLEHDYIPEDVCETLGISWSSIYHWKCNQAEYGDVVPSQNPLQGRPCLLTADRTEGLISTLCDSPEMYLDEIQDWVAVTHDTGISWAGLHALIRDAGITYKMLQKAASEQDEEACQQWQEFVHENLVTSMIITVDESSKDDQTIFWKYGHAPHGQCATINADFVCGEHYSILAAMSIDGYIGTRAVPGSVDGDKFFDFIVNDIVSFFAFLLCKTIEPWF